MTHKRRDKTLTKVIQGHTVIFRLTSQAISLFYGAHYSHRWYWSIDGEEFGTAKDANHIREVLPYNLKCFA